MGHVVPGSSAKRGRRETAEARLVKHLADHRKSHEGELLEKGEDWFVSHDKSQKAELWKIKELNK